MTACSNETILRAVATRARVALGAPLALDLFVLLRSLGEEGTRYSFSKLGSLLHDAQARPSCCLIQRWLPAIMRCFRPPRTALPLRWSCY